MPSAFFKIRTSRCASCLCVVFRWASQPRPSITQAFAAMLLADCCLQPNPAVWRNVKYSLLNCQARTGWEPSQAFTVQKHQMPPPHSNTTRPNQSLYLQPIQNQTSTSVPTSYHTPTSWNAKTPEHHFFNPLLLLHPYLKFIFFIINLCTNTLKCTSFALKRHLCSRHEKAVTDSWCLPSDICKIFLFGAPIPHWQRSLILGLAGLLTEPAGSAIQA